MDAYSSNSSEVTDSLDDENFRHILDDFKKTTLLTVQEPLTIALICFYVPVFVLALVGNVFVLVIIAPHRQMWSVTNNFLVNLAIADLLGTLSAFYQEKGGGGGA